MRKSSFSDGSSAIASTLNRQLKRRTYLSEEPLASKYIDRREETLLVSAVFAKGTLPFSRKNAVKIDLQDVTDTRKTLAVTLETAEIEAEEASLLDNFSKMARLPGFRPGKAPKQIIKKKFSKQMADELKQRIVTKAYRDGSKEAKVDLINVIDVDQGEIASGSEAKIIFTLDVRPQFEVKDYKGLEVTGLSEEVSDAERDEVIENIRRERAEFKEVEAEAKKGDYVKFSHEGTADGKPLSDLAPDKPVYAKMPQTWEEVGTEQGLIPGLSDKLEGLKKGDKKDVEIEFPEDFSVEGLRGVKATYAVEVQEVRERQLPEMDEAFFKAQQVKDLEELKERVSGMVKGRKSQEREADLRRQLAEALSASVEFTLPESLIEQETNNAMRQVVGDNARRGVSQEDMEANKEQIHASSVQTATSRVKLQLILQQIAEKESIEVSQEDLSRFVLNQAYQSGQKPDALVKELRKNQDQLQAAQQSVLFDKTLEFLVAEAKVSESTEKAET